MLPKTSYRLSVKDSDPYMTNRTLPTSESRDQREVSLDDKEFSPERLSDRIKYFLSLQENRNSALLSSNKIIRPTIFTGERFEVNPLSLFPPYLFIPLTTRSPSFYTCFIRFINHQGVFLKKNIAMKIGVLEGQGSDWLISSVSKKFFRPRSNNYRLVNHKIILERK